MFYPYFALFFTNVFPSQGSILSDGPSPTFLGVHSTSSRTFNDPQFNLVQARVFWDVFDMIDCLVAGVGDNNAQTMLTHNHHLLLFYPVLLDWI